MNDEISMLLPVLLHQDPHKSQLSVGELPRSHLMLVTVPITYSTVFREMNFGVRLVPGFKS